MLGVLLLLAGCTPTARSIEDPVATMLDRQRETSTRIAAIEASAATTRDAQRLRALRQLVFADMQPSALRLAAAEAWQQADERDYRQTMARRLRQIQDAALLTEVSEDAARGQWHELTPGLVRSLINEHVEWSNPRDRPELQTLQSLYPDQPIEATLFAFFSDRLPQSKGSPAARAEAWQVLAQLEGDQALGQRLLAAEQDSPWVTDLQRADADFGIMPTYAGDVAWLLALRSHEHQSLWAAARSAAESLPPSQRDGLAIRHIPMLARLAQTQPHLLSQSRDQLAAELLHRDATAQTFVKPQPRHVVQPVTDQRLRDWLDTLPWADLVGLMEMHTLMADDALVSQLFTQAEADRLDDSTEHGGLITLTDGHYTTMPYRPLLARNDQAYIPPANLFVDLHTAVAHYHFHAQKHANAEAAAPGYGDLSLADRIGAFYLVFTYVGPDTLNVDAYLRGRKSIDLGVIRQR